MGREHFRVDCLYRLDRWMPKGRHHDSRRNSSEFFLIRRLAVAAALAGVMTGRTGVKTIAPPSCTVMFTWSPTLRRATSMSALSNISPCELPIFAIVLTIVLNYV